MTCITAKRLSLAAAAALALSGVGSAPTASAQMRAWLPTIEQLEPLEALPIDGVWQIREIGKRVVIENGHAYAQNGWVHMMIFRIEPGQVVIKNIRELATGDFVGRDLPLVSNVTFEWVDEKTLRVSTQGDVKIVYHLDRIDFFEPDPEKDFDPIDPPENEDEDNNDEGPW